MKREEGFHDESFYACVSISKMNKPSLDFINLLGCKVIPLRWHDSEGRRFPSASSATFSYGGLSALKHCYDPFEVEAIHKTYFMLGTSNNQFEMLSHT